VGIDQAEIQAEGPAKDPERFTVLCPGKLLAIKGFHLAIDAFARSGLAEEGSRLVIAGDGPEGGRLRAQTRELGLSDQVDFVGWLDRSDLLARMAETDVVLFPSLRDGGGAVVVEAMAAGTPVVCLDHGGPGMHVTDEAGITVEPRGPEPTRDDLAAALREIEKMDPKRRATMAEQARRRAQDYTWSRHGDRLTEIYREALG